MPMTEIPILICDDCRLFLANGDLPEDRPDLAEDIDHAWPHADGWSISVRGDDEDFHAAPCDACRGPLAGGRWTATAYGPESALFGGR